MSPVQMGKFEILIQNSFFIHSTNLVTKIGKNEIFRCYLSTRSYKHGNDFNKAYLLIFAKKQLLRNI